MIDNKSELTQFFDFTDGELIKELRSRLSGSDGVVDYLIEETARRLETHLKMRENADGKMMTAHHHKRGTDYFVAPFEFSLQCSGRISEGTMLTMYVDRNNVTKKYARPTYEFDDGRFEINNPFEDKSCASGSSQEQQSPEP